MINLRQLEAFRAVMISRDICFKIRLRAWVKIFSP